MNKESQYVILRVERYHIISEGRRINFFLFSCEKLYYSVPQDDGGMFGTEGGGWNPISGKMQSNHWGPVPFVIALVLDRTPDHPSGSPSPEECVFRFGENEFVLPATW